MKYSPSRLQTINDYVTEKTHDKIKDLVKPSDLDSDTRLILINAVYFKGSWVSKFNANKTKKEPFHQAPGKEVQVDMMHQIGDEVSLFHSTNFSV